MKIFLPYRGEFGFVCMMHAPQVHAALTPGEDVVCIEPGREALYPGAAEYVHVDQREDAERRAKAEAGLLREWEGQMRKRYPGAELVRPDPDAPRAYFVPQPTVRYGIECDVFVCPRWRAYGPDKNWPHWPALVERLQAEGLRCFAGGAPDSSADVPCPRAWDHDRCLDATIEAMHAAKLVIATDAGLAHLAVLCGRPLVMITHANGYVAPGHDDSGNPYWPVKIDRYHRENHTGSPIDLVHHGWHSIEPTLWAVTARLEQMETAKA